MANGSPPSEGGPKNLPRDEELRSYHDRQLSFDRYAQLVCDILDVPSAVVSILRDQGQVFPGAVGLPEPWQSQRWTPLIHSVCLLVVQDGVPLAIDDARLDERTSANAAITDLDLVAYLGVPLTDGKDVVGAVCAIDRRPRQWTDREIHLLTGLTAVCSVELSLRGERTEARAGQQAAEAARESAEADGQRERMERLAAETARENAEQEGAQARAAQQRSEEMTAASQRSERHSRLLLSLSEALTTTTTVDSVIRVVQKAARTHLGAQVIRFEIADVEDDLAVIEEEPAAEDRTLKVALTGTLKGQLRLSWAPGDETWARFGPAAYSPHARSPIVETATSLVHYASTALDRAILLQERRSTAATLQHAMLTTLPRRTDLEMAARYVPAASANQVGGDWYDALPLDTSPAGPLAVVIGDVAGHDIEAAATMGQLRSILRGLLIDRRRPAADTITRLDTVVKRLGISGSSSLVLAVLHEHPDRPGAKQLSWANAGHPAPVRIDASGQATVLAGRPDLLLGFDLDWDRHDHHADLEPGDTIILYTDGLIEKPGRSLSEGQSRLMRSATEHHRLPLVEALDRILQDLIRNAPDDDCAVLGLRIP